MNTEEFQSLQYTRMSSGLMVQACPSSIITSEGTPRIQGEAAFAGSGFHEWMELRSKKKIVDLEEFCRLSGHDLQQMTTWWNNARFILDPADFADSTKVFTEETVTYDVPVSFDLDEFGHATNKETFLLEGHIDLALVDGDVGAVIDYKTTRRPEDEPDCIADPRMVGYALAWRDRHNLKSVKMQKVYPSRGPDEFNEQTDMLNSSNLNERREWFEVLWRNAYKMAMLDDPNQRSYFPRSWGKFRCGYCPGAKRCPGLKHELEHLHAFLGDSEQQPAFFGAESIRDAWWPMLEKARHVSQKERTLRDQIRDWVKENGPVQMDDGHELRLSDGSRPSLRVMKK